MGNWKTVSNCSSSGTCSNLYVNKGSADQRSHGSEIIAHRPISLITRMLSSFTGRETSTEPSLRFQDEMLFGINVRPQTQESFLSLPFNTLEPNSVHSEQHCWIFVRASDMKILTGELAYCSSAEPGKFISRRFVPPLTRQAGRCGVVSMFVTWDSTHYVCGKRALEYNEWLIWINHIQMYRYRACLVVKDKGSSIFLHGKNGHFR